MTTVQLRSYQSEAVVEILAAWASGTQRPAVVLPTGSGKTVIFAALASVCRRRGDRPLILVNRDELVQQTVAKLKAADPVLAVGVIQGKENELRGDVTVASVQTLSRVARLQKVDLNRFNVIVCDEAHFAAADSWRRVLEYFGAFKADSGCRIVGFTATMTRTDKRGLGEIWQDVVYTKDLRWAINQGYLVAPEAKTVIVPALQMDKIKTSHGDFSDGDLGKAMAQAKAGPLVAAAYAEHCRDAYGEIRRGICFTPTIDLAQSFLRDFRAAGIPTELVLGSTPREERRAAYEATASGVNRVLMSVGVLTTGFDLPAVEVAVIARPTKSAGLYVQMVGRVLRPSPDTGKSGAMILDVVGASRLGLASVVDLQLDKLQDDELIELDELDETGSPIMIPKVLPEAPDEIGWQSVNPFDGTSFLDQYDPPKPKAPKPKKDMGWDVTDNGLPFLRPTSNFDALIFIFQDEAGYHVGEMPKKGDRAKRLGTFDTMAEAVAEAEDSHPGPPSRLVGPASDAQKAWLDRQDIEYAEDLTKDQASRIMTQKLASWKLG
jgi:superfamily II DNA or RNA helicase